MRDIELASWENAPRRVDSIKRSLELIYGVKLEVDFEDVPLYRLYATEDFLENDKLALVFMKVVTEGYNVRIITVKRGDDYFVLDGHHRSFIFKKLVRKTIESYVLKFPRNTSYRLLPKHLLDDLPIKYVSVIDDSIVKGWGRILIVLKHYEALYNIFFYLRKKQACLRDLVPTESEIKRKQIDRIKGVLVPIVCVQHKGRYYILDGHARSLRAKQSGFESIQAMILSPEIQIDFGIVETAKEMGLKILEDIKIIE